MTSRRFAGTMLGASVAYVDVIGKSLDSGAIFSERITR